MVLKVTSILSRQQRDIAEKEAKLLSRLSHPSIVKIYDTCYRTVPSKVKGDKQKDRTQHLILMEYCEGGHAMDVCSELKKRGERFDLSTLIIAFGQICNAVSYLHAQRPPIVHRDLKPENFLIKNGAYKLCDFGSAVFGHVELKTPQARSEAEEIIEKTTTQMFRAPEMVDLYMAKKLTQATDVWALGCCLYSLAFLQNCFEEGSNLAILSRNFKIPDDNPYGEGLTELIDRMLDLDSKARADMTEVILCLSAVYSGKPLPPRKEKKSKDKKDKESSEKEEKKKKKAGTFNTSGQGVSEDLTLDPKKVKEAKKLDPNSAAARRRAAAGGDTSGFAKFDNTFDSTFAPFEAKEGTEGGALFGSFDGGDSNADFNASQDWDADFDGLAHTSGERGRSSEVSGEHKTRARSHDHRRRRKDKPKDETPEETIERLASEDEEEAAGTQNSASKKKAVPRRGVRRTASSKSPAVRSASRGAGLRRTKSGQARNQNRSRGSKDEDDDDDDDGDSDSE